MLHSSPVIHNDSLGHMNVLHGHQICGYCGKDVMNCTVYQSTEIQPIEHDSTMLKRTHAFGIECGCYGKLHRQIAHIRDSMKGCNGS